MVSLNTCMYVCLSVCVNVWVCMCVCVCMSVCGCVCLSTCPISWMVFLLHELHSWTSALYMAAASRSSRLGWCLCLIRREPLSPSFSVNPSLAPCRPFAHPPLCDTEWDAMVASLGHVPVPCAEGGWKCVTEGLSGGAVFKGKDVKR